LLTGSSNRHRRSIELLYRKPAATGLGLTISLKGYVRNNGISIIQGGQICSGLWPPPDVAKAPPFTAALALNTNENLPAL
ncbi:MAG: hypothetical protein AB8B86_15985, partial [Pseudomonadales bacterium]